MSFCRRLICTNELWVEWRVEKYAQAHTDIGPYGPSTFPVGILLPDDASNADGRKFQDRPISSDQEIGERKGARSLCESDAP